MLSLLTSFCPLKEVFFQRLDLPSLRAEQFRTMRRRLRAIVPPFGVEEDVRWVEEDVPEDDGETGSDGEKNAEIADGGGGGGGDASTSSTSSTSTLEPEVLAPGVRRCLPPAPPPASKPSLLAILK